MDRPPNYDKRPRTLVPGSRTVSRASLSVVGMGVAFVLISYIAGLVFSSHPLLAADNTIDATPTPGPAATADPNAIGPQPFVLATSPPEDAGLIDREYTLVTETITLEGVGRPHEMFTYTVRDGDTVFGIAYAFGLSPETVLWSNYGTLRDNPDLLKLGQELTIPPVDGLVVEVEAGDTLDALARRFKAEPDAVAADPINKLASVNQALFAGQQIFIPNGQRETVVWQVPKLIEVRRNAVTGVRTYRVGTCGEIAIPQLGTGSFRFPANRTYLSGYNFGAVHPGLDFAGRLGEPIYAADSGTVIYAGFSLNASGAPVGYGQYVVLDHGNGYQTLYAHASHLDVRCGQQISKGEVIAEIGSVGRSTGPHLHFEIRSNGMAVNPWNYLKP